MRTCRRAHKYARTHINTHTPAQSQPLFQKINSSSIYVCSLGEMSSTTITIFEVFQNVIAMTTGLKCISNLYSNVTHCRAWFPPHLSWKRPHLLSWATSGLFDVLSIFFLVWSKFITALTVGPFRTPRHHHTREPFDGCLLVFFGCIRGLLVPWVPPIDKPHPSARSIYKSPLSLTSCRSQANTISLENPTKFGGLFDDYYWS